MHTAADSDIDIEFVTTSRPSVFGRIRTCFSLSVTEWSTIGISFLTIAIGIGFSIYRLVTMKLEDPDMVFAILVIINLCFASYYLVHGIFQEQPFELLTLSITLLLVWILIIINYFSGTDLQLKKIRLRISSVLTILNILLSVTLGIKYWDSGYLVFKTVGGSIVFQRCCRQLFFAYSLIIFDLQAQFCSLILVMQNGLSNITTDNVITIILGAVYALVWAGVGYYAMRSENFRLTCLFGIASLPQFIYVIFLFTQAVRLFESKYSVLTIATYTTIIALLLSHLTLMGMTLIVTENYEKGLRQKVYGYGPRKSNNPIRGINDTSDRDLRNPLLIPGRAHSTNYEAI